MYKGTNPKGGTEAMKHKLSAKKVENAKGPAMLGDGGGLYLRVSPKDSKSWVYRWRDPATKKLQSYAIGTLDKVGLADAREEAEKARKLVHKGGNPVTQRQAEREAAKLAAEAAENVMTFDRAAARFITEKLAPECKSSKTAKTVPQWESSIAAYVSPIIGSKDVAEIGTDEVLSVLRPIWKRPEEGGIPETAARVRMRLERILAWCAVQGYRDIDRINPAVWRGHLSEILPARAKLQQREHFAALPYKELPKLYAELKNKDSLTALALRWTMLNTCRTGESIGAQWAEIEDGVWSIPPERMKAGKLHRIPLSGEAAAILTALDDSGQYLFPAGNHGRQKHGHMSNAAMLAMIGDLRPGYTVHGMRSAFRDWASETTEHENFVCEMQLAHVVGGVEGAYRRGDLMEKRAKLVNDWAQYLTKGN
jgi:integrase